MELRVVSTGPGVFYIEEYRYGMYSIGKRWHKLQEYHGSWGGGDYVPCVFSSEGEALEVAKEYAERKCKEDEAERERKRYVDEYKPVYIKYECK